MTHSSKINIAFSSYILFGRSIDIARDSEWIMLNDIWVKNGKTTSELCRKSLSCHVFGISNGFHWIRCAFPFFCFGIGFVVSSLICSMWVMRLCTCVRLYVWWEVMHLCCAVCNATDKYQNWIWRGRIYVSCDDYCYCLCYVCQQLEITSNTKKCVKISQMKRSLRWNGGMRVKRMVWKDAVFECECALAGMSGWSKFWFKKKVNATETEKM